MFTGIVQAIGQIDSIEGDGESARIRLRLPQGFGPLEAGESLAVDGICLTAGDSMTTFLADVSWETLSRTTLGRKNAGESVNLERALRPIDRLGGHFVTGHIDGTGTIRHFVRHAQSWELSVQAPAAVLMFCVEKGSIAIDGISLTLASLDDSGFTCAMIPHTLDQTTLKARQAGDVVNLEADLIGKYVHRFTRGDSSGSTSTISLKTLSDAGFL